MKIGIPLSKFAYTPEAYAYEKYLLDKGYAVQLDYELDVNNDINIYFMGSRPFWKKDKGKAKEIHEYQSLSIPPYANLKNLTKMLINKKPSGYIFLNNFVHEGFKFENNKPFIYRDMGVDEMLFQKPYESPVYDVLYCGSISGRVGLIKTLLKLAKNYKVIVIGQVKENERRLLLDKNITLTGVINRNDLPEVYRNARFGLNYTPDIYPYNIQTSTKTLEYLAAGLGVISNRYEWAETFFKEINYQPIWLDNNLTDILESKVRICENIKDFSWSKVLTNSNFEGFLNECLYEK